MEKLIPRSEFPKVKELVIGVVTEVFPEFAYVELPEYGCKKAMLHITEASEKWIKSVKEVVKEGDVRVFRVVNVNPQRGYIDVSLRHINPSQERRKFLEWRRKLKVHSILRVLAEKHGYELKELYEKVVWPLEDKYGEAYAAFEEALLKGKQVLEEAIPDKELVERLYAEISHRLSLQKVRLAAELNIYCLQPDGIERIKRVLLTIYDKYKQDNIEIKYISAPKYRIAVEDYDYKSCAKKLEAVCKELVELGKQEGVFVSYSLPEKK
ncbi:MAG: translation initiation factor IF-2 subunit alpha [bacterium]|nr:translation initiation factor IF-2 subunit alpha [bacterium]